MSDRQPDDDLYGIEHTAVTTGSHYTVLLGDAFDLRRLTTSWGRNTFREPLRNAIRVGRAVYAYMFTGASEESVKLPPARILAKALNCPNVVDGVPCNHCEICDGISAGNDVDVLEIDGASNRGIDDIRSLRANVGVRSMRTQFKVYIIDEVHMLTKEAFNALLKTLEEPPPNVKFVFCTTEPNKVPDTILSRCQRFEFQASMIAHLRIACGRLPKPKDRSCRRCFGEPRLEEPRSMRDSQCCSISYYLQRRDRFG
ncbi:MAG: AAA family ATPase [Planctomycetaceae bacterium]